MFYRRSAVAGALGLLCLSIPTLTAADTYFSLFGGYTDVDDADFQIAPGTVSTAFDGGYGLGAAFGKRLGAGSDRNSWRVEGELAYRSNDVDSHSLGGASLPGATGKFTSTAVMANVLIDFNAASTFSPYLGGGLGLANVSADGFGVAAIPSVVDGDDTVLAYQLIAGAGWDVSPKTELFAEYRYFATDDLNVTTSAATGSLATDLSYKSNNIFVGVRFNN